MRYYLPLFLSLLLALPVSANQDQFSRANCWNNESLTFSLLTPPESRAVFSWHFKNGVRKHYVTENPADPATCRISGGGFHQVSGLYCFHHFTTKRRHAAIHGRFLSSEPNPDGNLTPGTTSAWRTEGIHTLNLPGIGGFSWPTNARNCNLHYSQFY